MYIGSRNIYNAPVVPNKREQIPLPADGIYEELQIRISGAIRTTYASGTPVASAFDILHDLVTSYQIVIAGKTYKNVTGYMMMMEELMVNKIRGERAGSAGASAAAGGYPTTEGTATFPYGTTTQYTSTRQSIRICFAYPFAKQEGVRLSTCLDLRGQRDAWLYMQVGPMLNMLGYGNTAPVTYDDSTLQFDIQMIENHDFDAIPDIKFDIFQQNVYPFPIIASMDESLFDLQVGNFCSALTFMARDGAAGSATTATGRLLNNLMITDLDVKINSKDSICPWEWPSLAANTRRRYAPLALQSSNVGPFDGIARIDFCRIDGNIQSDSLNLTPSAGVQTLKLVVSSAAASLVTYTAGGTLEVMQDTLIKRRAS